MNSPVKMRLPLPVVQETEPGRVIEVEGHRFVNQDLALHPGETDHYLTEHKYTVAYKGTIWAREDRLFPVAP